MNPFNSSKIRKQMQDALGQVRNASKFVVPDVLNSRHPQTKQKKHKPASTKSIGMVLICLRQILRLEMLSTH